MSREREYLEDLDLSESLTAYDYLLRQKIDTSILFDRGTYPLSFPDILEDNFPEDKNDQLSLGIITRTFPSMPLDDLDDAAELLLDGIEETREIMLAEMFDNFDNYQTDDIKQVDNFEIDHLADYARRISESKLKTLKASDISAEESFKKDAVSLYWLRIKTIATAAMIIAGEREQAKD